MVANALGKGLDAATRAALPQDPLLAAVRDREDFRRLFATATSRGGQDH